jgi:amidase
VRLAVSEKSDAAVPRSGTGHCEVRSRTGEDPLDNTAGAPFASIEQLQVAYRQGALSVADMVEMFVDRIDRYDQRGPKINGVVRLNPAAHAEARRLDGRLTGGESLAGPLHGVPVLVKDQIETAGVETNFGSVAMRGYVPRSDATVVGRLKRAGAIVLAKSSMPDFAASWFSLSSRTGATRCPWALERDAGGSSSGSAAGVAAGFATAAIGEDTGGSIRIPAAYNHLVGVRVTTGLISRHGMAPLVHAQDTPGPITRTVRDAATLLDVLVGVDPQDSLTYTANRGAGKTGFVAAMEEGALQGRRIGLLTEALSENDDSRSRPVTVAFGEALQILEHQGAVVVPVSLPSLNSLLAQSSLYERTSRADINRFLASRSAPYGDVAEIVRRGLYERSLDLLVAIARSQPSAEDVQAGFTAQMRLRQALLQLISGHRLDAICYPTTPVAAPSPEELRSGQVSTSNFPTNTIIASQAGLPAITLPCGDPANGLPVGIELMAPPYQERLLVNLGADFERATPPVGKPLATP